MMAHDGVALAKRLRLVQDDIHEAAREAEREPTEITTIVVTKFHPASMVRELAELGIRHFGESRHQEARDKVLDVNNPKITWHFVGQVQGKKARQIASYAHTIHAIDRESLVVSLASDERTVDCFIQLNLTDNPARGGVALPELLPLAERTLATEGVRLLGVMAIAPLGENARRAFSRVRDASDELRTVAPNARSISMGMSGDYREAVLEGATHLRIGTAITGNRPTPR